MTPPVTTEALVAALAYLKPHETNGGTISLKATKAREAVAVIEAALQRVTAERDEATGLRARVKFLETEWSEATDRHEAAVREQHHLEEKLDKEKRARRAAEASLATANAELAQLRAEGEAKDRARDDVLIALKVFAQSGLYGAKCEVQEWLRAGAQGPVPFYDGALFRMWAGANGFVNRDGFLARAATASEGA